MATFVAADELDRVADEALDWLRAASARDVLSHVIVYTLTRNQRDFQSCAPCAPHGYRDQIRLGTRIRHRGLAYTDPYTRFFRLTVDDRFEVIDVLDDDLEPDSRSQTPIDRNGTTGSVPLIVTATFD
jgi:hypothetical protein